MPPRYLRQRHAKAEERSLPADVLELLTTCLRAQLVERLSGAPVREAGKIALVNRALARMVREHYEYWASAWCAKVVLYDRTDSPHAFAYRHLR